MPTYEYQCTACAHAFEEFHSIKAPSLKKCPKCGKLKLKRLIGTGAGIIFKGSGFYETDYRSASYKAAAKAEANSGGGAGASSTTSSTATPATPAKSATDTTGASPATKSESTSGKKDSGTSKPTSAKKD